MFLTSDYPTLRVFLSYFQLKHLKILATRCIFLRSNAAWLFFLRECINKQVYFVLLHWQKHNIICSFALQVNVSCFKHFQLFFTGKQVKKWNTAVCKSKVRCQDELKRFSLNDLSCFPHAVYNSLLDIFEVYFYIFSLMEKHLRRRWYFNESAAYEKQFSFGITTSVHLDCLMSQIFLNNSTITLLFPCKCLCCFLWITLFSSISHSQNRTWCIFSFYSSFIPFYWCALGVY